MRTSLLVSILSATVFAVPDYRLVWNDEFDTTGLPNPKKWYYDVGGGGWGSNQLQFYKAANPKNSWVDSGVLKISVHREDTTYSDELGNTQTSHLSSARLNTYDRQLWKYGRFEVRMKLPGGIGQWPALWLAPPAGSPYGQWPASGTITVLENFGVEPTIVHGSVHTKNNYGETSHRGYAVVECPNDSFHLYALDWQPDTITISVDGKEYFRYSNPRTTYADWPFDQPSFLILNAAVSGIWGEEDTPDTTHLPQSLVVDYVRVYQDPNIAITSSNTTIPVIPAKSDFSASLSGGNLAISADRPGSWLLRRLDGTLVGQGRLGEHGEARLAIDSKGILILSYRTWDGRTHQTPLTGM